MKSPSLPSKRRGASISDHRRFSFSRFRNISTEHLAILASLFFSLTANHLFFSAALSNRDWSQGSSWLFALAMFVTITALHAAGLLLVFNRWSAKPILTVLLIATAGASFYMDKYTVFFDPDMVRNVLRTDVKEASELFSLGLAIHMLLYAVLPAIVVWWLHIQRRQSWLRAAMVRLLYLIAAIVLTAGSIFVVFQDFSSLMRNHKEVRYLITPSNYLYSLTRVLSKDSAHADKAIIPINTDAKLAAGWGKRDKPLLFIMVVGETTRAANWGLNGYTHQTTPELSKLDVMNFSNVTSCGTNTEVSVPCMFSPYGRHNYDQDAIQQHQSLLHILDHVGIKTIWRDNQAGCKHVCDGLEEQRLDNSKDLELCAGDRCLDEIMLKDLGAEIKKANNGNLFIVLHQLGNHGPAYYRRYPDSLRKFTPTCDTPDLSKCTREQIVNSYDNAVLYTDYFVAKTIAFLKQQTTYDTALWYMSDHGESLGENGIYLHGMPYSIAPKEQTHVPMVLWMSQNFTSDFGLNRDCLAKKTSDALSQDYLFSSILGMLQIHSRYYDPAYDLSASCRK